MRRLLAALLLSLIPATALAGGSLEAEVAAATWPRTVTGTLQGVAAVRVIEIQTTFAHRPMPELAHWSWGEVIAWNSGYTDPIGQTVIMWRNSPSHWAVLTGNYSHIGCASDWAGSRFYAVCLLGTPPQGGSAPSGPIIDEIPDTALPETYNQLLAFFQERDSLLFGIFAVLALLAFVCAHRLTELDDYFAAHPQARQAFQLWKRERGRRHLCPQHNIVIMRGACPVCGWKPK